MEISIKEHNKITQPQEAYKILQSILDGENEIDRDKEHFWVIGLSTNKVIKYLELVSLGNLNCSIVHPREVFRMAITKGVDTLIVAHNHPSGEINPSREDIRIMKNLIEAGKIIGIAVVDHIIIADSMFYSFREQGLL